MADVADYTTWLPRFVSHGVDYSDFVSVTSRVGSWGEWHDAWLALGDFYEEAGNSAQRYGNTRTAGEALLRAALSYHYAKYIWLEEVTKYWDTTARCISAHRRAMSLLDDSFERIEIPFGEGVIVANLRRPKDQSLPPLVVIVPGMDSTKEEFTAWEDFFLARGMATVSVDGPGQGEAGRVNPMSPAHELVVGALLDVVESHDDIDASRVGITGVGLGGFLATRSAAFEPRVIAAGVIGGAYRYENMPELIRAKFAFNCFLQNEEEMKAHADSFTTEGVMEHLDLPYLVIHGDQDAVMATDAARKASEEAPMGEFVVYAGGNTACQSVNHRLRPMLADWFRGVLTADVVPVRRGSVVSPS